ncbi:MAG TPA: SH3 domain-containing protein [Terriglobales bacterium]|nr:SH3 domain-containing protein [Terriglobales bacterium]
MPRAMKDKIRASAALLMVLTVGLHAWAQARRGAPLRVASIYLAPDPTSAKLGQIERGREVIVLESSRDWLKVEANLTEERTLTGWIQQKEIVDTTVPNGDRILFGEAVDSEEQASERQGRRGAAQDAIHLYYEVYDLFPNSPLAGEGLYRAADIRWQIDKADVMSRPSAREKEAYLREGMNEDSMRLVIKKFPGTKWADLAAFHLIENKLCGDWQASSKCPLKEAEMYEKYAEEHPHSPTVAEALYNAAWRLSALIEIYKTENQPKKSEESKAKALALAQKVSTQFPQSDWGARAERLVFLIVQGVPTYGNAEP